MQWPGPCYCCRCPNALARKSGDTRKHYSVLSFTFSDASLMTLGEEFYVGFLRAKPDLEYGRCVWGLLHHLYPQLALVLIAGLMAWWSLFYIKFQPRARCWAKQLVCVNSFSSYNIDTLPYLKFFKIIFYYNIFIKILLTYHIILVSGVEHSDLTITYIMKCSPH